MVSFLLIILVVAFTLSVVLVIGSLFFQGYLYTEPNSGILWRAPVAGVVLTAFLALWCILNANSADATPTNIPYDTVFTATGSVDLVDQPVPQLWVIRKGVKEPIKYVRRKFVEGGFAKVEYVEAGSKRPWRNPESIEAVLIEHNGEKMRFEPQPPGQGGYRDFVSPEGWVMPEYERGVTGLPTAFHTGLYLVALLLNFLFLVLWVVLLWLVVRFQFWHAVTIGFIMWLVFTLFVIPNLLVFAVRPGVLKEASSSTAAPSQTPAPTPKKQKS